MLEMIRSAIEMVRGALQSWGASSDIALICLLGMISGYGVLLVPLGAAHCLEGDMKGWQRAGLVTFFVFHLPIAFSFGLVDREFRVWAKWEFLSIQLGLLAIVVYAIGWLARRALVLWVNEPEDFQRFFRQESLPKKIFWVIAIFINGYYPVVHREGRRRLRADF